VLLDVIKGIYTHRKISSLYCKNDIGGARLIIGGCAPINKSGGVAHKLSATRPAHDSMYKYAIISGIKLVIDFTLNTHAFDIASMLA